MHSGSKRTLVHRQIQRSVTIKQLENFLKSDHWLRRYCILSAGVFYFEPPCRSLAWVQFIAPTVRLRGAKWTTHCNEQCYKFLFTKKDGCHYVILHSSAASAREQRHLVKDSKATATL